MNLYKLILTIFIATIPTMQFACSEKINAAMASGIRKKRTYHDGSRVTEYNNKTVVINNAHGRIQILFPDQIVLNKFPNDTVEVVYPDKSASFIDLYYQNINKKTDKPKQLIKTKKSIYNFCKSIIN